MPQVLKVRKRAGGGCPTFRSLKRGFFEFRRVDSSRKILKRIVIPNEPRVARCESAQWARVPHVSTIALSFRTGVPSTGRLCPCWGRSPAALFPMSVKNLLSPQLLVEPPTRDGIGCRTLRS